MASKICFRCFKVKGDYAVCPNCGFVEGTKAEQEYQLNPGTILKKRYIVGICIGYGGFGITYRSYDTVLRMIVAIKEFYPAGLVNRGAGESQIGIFSGDKKEEFARRKERFLQEAHNMAIFSKEKDIVNVFDYFEENQTAYIIMEYIEGELLKAQLERRKRIPAAEASDYMLAILEALQKLHDQGIIHRDVSPDNIFLTGEKTIKLFDFGVAKFQDTQTERSGEAVVKAGYTPPEQYRTTERQGPFVDVYAAGAVFYQLVTGEKPLEATDRVVDDTLRAPRELGVEIDANLERIIMKAMALKVENRFQTAREFRDAIISGKKVRLENTGKVRNFIIAAVSAAVIAIALIMAAVIRISRTNDDKINVAAVKGEKLVIWLCVPEDADIGDNTEKNDTQSEAEGHQEIEAAESALLEVIEKDYPSMDIEVTGYKPGDYGQKLAIAIQNGELPDVFCTDTIDAAKYCCSLDPLLKTFDRRDFLFWDRIAQKKTSAVEIPTAAQLAVIYQNDRGAAAMELGQLERSENIRLTTDEKALEEFDRGGEKAVIVGNLEDRARVQEVTLLNRKNATSFSVAPILDKGNIVGNYRFCYGVKKGEDEKKQQAGMLVLAELCGSAMQRQLYMANDAGIPVNRETYTEYQKYTYFSFISDYDLERGEMEEGKDTHAILKRMISTREDGS